MKNGKKNIISIIKLFIFFIVSFLLFLYFKSGINEYNSILDKYLNFNYIVFIRTFCVLNLVFSICFLILLVLSIIKRNKDNRKISKTVSAIFIVIFIMTNAVSGVYVINFQAHEDKVIDTIPDSVGSYVDFNKIFEISPDDYFHEQTVFNKISTEIPINYDVQQSSSNNSVQTSCIEIIDDKLLSEYYNEQENRYSQHNIIEFNDYELKLMSVDKGFYYMSDNYSLGIVVIKGDKLFDIYIFSKEIEITDVIIQQVASL